MSKKTWIIIACLVMSLAMGLGGSLAYLTDRDADVNVFTMGNVDIELVEDYTQGSALVPGVKINKDAHIKNTGNNNAWVWMTVAVPENLQAGTGIDNSTFNPVHVNVPGKNWLGYQNVQKYWDEDQTEATPAEKCWIVDYTEVENGYTDANGVKYRVLTHLYNGVLKPGEETTIALTQVYMDSHVDITPNGDLYWVDKGVTTNLNWNIKTQGDPVIYVSAYAIQEQGFKDVEEAYAAYNTQWTTVDAEGKPLENKGLIWAELPAKVSNEEELIAAIKAGGMIQLTQDVVVSDYIKIDQAVVIDLYLNGKTLSCSKEGTEIFYVNNAEAELNIHGEGTLKTNHGYSVWANKGVAKIHGGLFTGDTVHHVYVSTEGKAEIYGGEFHPATGEHGYILNERDQDRENSSILVFGGSFMNWNPADNGAEGAGTNFVHEEHMVVVHQDGEDTWYDVWYDDESNRNQAAEHGWTIFGE